MKPTPLHFYFAPFLIMIMGFMGLLFIEEWKIIDTIVTIGLAFIIIYMVMIREWLILLVDIQIKTIKVLGEKCQKK